MRRDGYCTVRSTATAVAVAMLAFGASAAPVYRLVDADGRVTFTDMPGPGAERFLPDTPNTYRARQPQSRPPEPAPVQRDAFTGYRGVAIAWPKAEAVRANDGRIRIVAATEPSLQSGHRAVVLLDGQAAQRSEGLTFELAELDRGRHELSVRIVDGDGQVLAQSRPKIIHLLRASRRAALK
ncbi:MAG: DUF4124 domain-containing protein [Gammaproteobacteria bacterium]|nr:DUF4124 domain-containing protein [Gammaproteobacteria bacterium]